jgi:hypothetical protein
MTGSHVSVVTGVKRGQSTWAYIYVFLGFALTIEGNVIQMLQISAFCEIASFVVIGFATGWLFLDNAWFQNKLVRLKNTYEEKTR